MLQFQRFDIGAQSLPKRFKIRQARRQQRARPLSPRFKSLNKTTKTFLNASQLKSLQTTVDKQKRAIQVSLKLLHKNIFENQNLKILQLEIRKFVQRELKLDQPMAQPVLIKSKTNEIKTDLCQIITNFLIYYKDLMRTQHLSLQTKAEVLKRNLQSLLQQINLQRRSEGEGEFSWRGYLQGMGIETQQLLKGRFKVEVDQLHREEFDKVIQESEKFEKFKNRTICIEEKQVEKRKRESHWVLQFLQDCPDIFQQAAAVDQVFRIQSENSKVEPMQSLPQLLKKRNLPNTVKKLPEQTLRTYESLLKLKESLEFMLRKRQYLQNQQRKFFSRQ